MRINLIVHTLNSWLVPKPTWLQNWCHLVSFKTRELQEIWNRWGSTLPLSALRVLASKIISP